MRKKMMALALTGAVAAGTLSACGGGSSAENTVTLWQFNTDPAVVAAWEKAVADFEAANPDIDVVMQTVPWSEQQQKISTAIATNALPDVSMLGNNVVAQYQAQGQLLALDDYMTQWASDEGVEDVAADYWPGDELYYKLDGSWWAAPLTEETRLLYYRKDMFSQVGLDPEKPPATWEELAEAATRLKEVSDVPLAVSMGKDYQTLHVFSSVYLGYGATMLDGDACGFDTPQFREALGYYTDLHANGLTSKDAVTYTGDQMMGLFKTGDAAMTINNPSVLAQMRSEGVDFVDEIGIAQIPAGPEGQYGFLGGWPLVLWKQSKNPDAAAEFIHYMTSPDGAIAELNEVGGNLPGRQSVAGQAPWDAFPYDIEVAQMPRAVPYQYPDPEIPQMGVIEVETIQNAVTRVATGEMDVDASTVQLCKDIDEALS